LALQNIRMTAEEYQLLDEYLSKNFGITFPEHKLEILESRLRPRLAALKMSSFMDYYLALQFGTNGTGEVIQLLRLITNNETYFFRETHQMEALFSEGIDQLRVGGFIPSELKILCAGCSSGEEPYTLKMFAAENAEQLHGSKLQISAFDIDDTRVAMAQKGEYGPHSLRGVDQARIQKFFQPIGKDLYRVKDEYRGVQISKGNLLEIFSYRDQPYDVIFCRNVLIYFSETALRKTVEHFASALREGGLLFLGHAESIIGMSRQFETTKLKNCIVYRRVTAPSAG